MKSAALVGALIVLSLSGCASNRYCQGEQPYEKAETLPPLQPVSGVKIPENPGALKIPPPLAKPVPFGSKTEEGKNVCLDKPPALPAASLAPGPDPEKGEEKGGFFSRKKKTPES